MNVKFKAPGTLLRLDLKTEILPLLRHVLKVIAEQPMLLRLKAPLVIGTDIHG